MRREHLVIRFLAIFMLALTLVVAGPLGAFAQDDGTPPAVEEEITPEPEPSEEPAALQGTLSIFVYVCSDGSDEAQSGLLRENEFAPDESCLEGGTVEVAIDDGAAEIIDSGAQYLLDEGVHLVSAPELSAALEVEIAESAPVTLFAVFYEILEESGAPLPAGSILIMKHICPAEIQSQEDFDEIGDFIAKVQTCPVITLPGDLGPEGSVNGNDLENQLTFDFSVDYDDNGAPASKVIADAAFVPEQVCESGLGFDIDGVLDNDLCLDTSHYEYSEIARGLVSVTESIPPDGYGFGTLELSPDSGDEAAEVGVFPESGLVELDTTDDDHVVLHVYNFVKEPENQIRIVKHQCDETVTTTDDFDEIGDFLDKWQACPVITRGDDNGPEGSIGGGQRTFLFDVEGSDGAQQTWDNSTFVPDQLCESDLGEDLNGDPNDDICLDASYYRFDNVLQGPGVLVIETKSPKDYQFGAVEFDPNSGELAALVQASDDGVIELDTTLFGSVTLHVFNLKTPDEPEPTPEPDPFGSVQVIKLYCLSDFDGAEIYVLDPGQEATSSDLGDDTCIAGNADFEIALFGTDYLEPFDVGDDGVIILEDIAVTDGDSGPHTITELFYEVSADFDVEADKTTRIIVLNYEEELIDDEEEEDDYDDESDIESGEDLAETGIGPREGPVSGAMVLMLAGMGGFVLFGARLTRRRLF